MWSLNPTSTICFPSVIPKWNPALKMCKYVWPDIRPVVWTGEEYRLREAWFTCSRTVPQWCEFEKSRPTSIEQLEKQAVDDGKWRRARWSTLVSHGGEWTYIFQPIGNALVYCYWISNVVFVNLTTAVASWTVCTRIFIPLTANHRKLRHHWAYEHKVLQADYH